MKKSALIAVAVSALTLTGTVAADSLLGLYAGVSSWKQNYDGSIRDLNSADPQEIDFNKDLGLDEESGNVIYVALEHGIPFLPNIKLQSTEIETKATGKPSRTINYGGQPFLVTDTINTEADLSHTDLTLYYQVLDNWVSLDLGLTVRLFDGFVSIERQSDGNSAREDFDAPVPLLYANARADLPFAGAYASINAHALGDGDNMFVDFQLTVGYEHALGAGVELGFRSMDLDLEDIDDIEVDLTIDGAFIGVFYHL